MNGQYLEYTRDKKFYRDMLILLKIHTSVEIDRALYKLAEKGETFKYHGQVSVRLPWTR